MNAIDQIREPLSVRQACRTGGFDGPTSGQAPGFAQGNLAILPADLAKDFLAFCRANPKPCPILGVSERGDPHIPELGADLDIRTDLPRYRVWKKGELVDEPTNVATYWRDDLVSFVIGCSFSFEELLLQAGLSIRHIEARTTVPMYRTSLTTTPVGPFGGPVVVSMRPFKAADAIRAIEITSRYPQAHGAPVHFGRPDLIGIRDIGAPDFGEPSSIAADEVPVFWACGVTLQQAVETAKPDFAITHAPGRMIVTDVPIELASA
ncbi:MAG: putative hydro-lyase [Proteobacteria bacterium]|nr:putative hydro-lyase [Pseudomonadota bacterium]